MLKYFGLKLDNIRYHIKFIWYNILFFIYGTFLQLFFWCPVSIFVFLFSTCLSPYLLIALQLLWRVCTYLYMLRSSTGSKFKFLSYLFVIDMIFQNTIRIILNNLILKVKKQALIYIYCLEAKKTWISMFLVAKILHKKLNIIVYKNCTVCPKR